MSVIRYLSSMNFSRSIFFSALTTTIAIVLLGCYYEYTENIMGNMLDGILTNGVSVGNLGFLENYKIQKVYVWLYRHIPEIPWFPTVLLVSVIIAGAIFIHAIYALDRISTFTRGVLTVTWITAFMLPSIVNLQYTRSSFLLAAAALQLGFGLVKIRLPFKNGIAFLLFSVALFTRLESATAVLGIYTCAYFIFRKSALGFVQKAAPAYLLVIFVLSLMFIERKHIPSFIHEIEPEIEYQFLARNHVVPLSTMKNSVDSAKYIAARAWLIGDSVHVSPAFMRSLIAPNPSVFLPAGDIFQAWKILAVKEFSSLTGLLVILIMVLVASVDRCKTLALFSVFLFFILLPSLFIETESRHVVSMAGIFFILALQQKNYTRLPNAVVAVLLVLPAFAVYNLYQTSNEYGQVIAKNKEVFTYLNKTFPGRKIMIGEFDYFNRPAFRVPVYMKVEIIEPDMSQVGYTPEMKDVIRNMFPTCDIYDYACRYRYMQSIKNDVVIVSSSSRMMVMKTYLKAVHHLDWNYHEVKPIDCLPDTYVYLLD